MGPETLFIRAHLLLRSKSPDRWFPASELNEDTLVPRGFGSGLAPPGPGSRPEPGREPGTKRNRTASG